MTRVAIGLGGNLGDVAAHFRRAVAIFTSAPSTDSVLAISPVYKTPPFGPPGQPDYLNACLTLDWSADVSALYQLCIDSEKECGREQRERWGARTLDCDILLFGDAHIQSDRLTIPHYALHARATALIPLNDIAADWWVAGADKKVFELVAALPPEASIGFELQRSIRLNLA